MARLKPAWPPGTRLAYHAITLGFYEGELLRRVDPQHRSLGQFFQDEIASPLGLDAYVRLPESITNDQLATLQQSNPFQLMTRMPFRLLLTSMNPRSPIFRGLVKPNPGGMVVFDDEHIYARNFEVPSGGGVGSARGIARAYSAFATGGDELGLRAETLQALMAPTVPAAHGFYDEAIKQEVQFSLGFFKPSPPHPFGRAGAFGSPGAGGCNAFADPERQIAYAYVHNRMGGVLEDARDLALRDALDGAMPERAVVPEVNTGAGLGSA
jgi:CubicO group peptidase (beta-lactamase class C family)